MSETATLTAAAVPPDVHHRQRKDWFYAGAAVFVLLLSAAGFLPSLVDPSRRAGPPTPLVAAHGAAAGAWIVLFLIQSMLAANRRMRLHRRLGIVGLVLAAAMVVTGPVMVIDMTRRGYDLSGDIVRMAVAPGAAAPTRDALVTGMLGPLDGFATFAILVALALWFRHRPDVHKRLMLFALLSLVFTPLIHLGGYLVGHWPGLHGAFSVLSPLVATLVTFAAAVHDKVSRGRVHPVSWWVPLLLLVKTVGVIVVVGPSDGWRRLAMWLVR